LSLSLSRRALVAGAAAGLLLPRAARAAAPLRISVAEFPDGVYTPTLVELLRLSATRTGEASAEIVTAPFARSLAALMEGRADLHLPMLRPPHPENLPFSLATATLDEAPFVLYTNKDKPIDIASLHTPGKYRIETDIAHVDYFDIPVTGGANAASSLKKVDTGRIDGYIFSANSCDPIVVAEGLKNIHRTLYRVFQVTGVLPKGGVGNPADQWLTAAVTEGARDPAWVALQQKLLSGYRGPDWQPA
jgi:polar amino acid transport system substrate-binding protein